MSTHGGRRDNRKRRPDDKRGGSRPHPRLRRRISQAAARRLYDALGAADTDAALSALIMAAPRDLFQVAAECVAEMGKIAEPEDRPIII